MVTQIGKNQRRRHLYIKEWMESRGYSDTTLAGRMDKDRTTVWRWVNEQHRLNPEKIAAIAAALDVEPEELWSLPPPVLDKPRPPSIDAELEDADDDTRNAVLDLARRLVSRRAN